MASSFADLTDAQQTKYRATCTQLGLDPEHQPKLADFAKCRGPRVLSADPALLRWPGPVRVIEVQTVAEFKAISGHCDEVFLSGDRSDRFVNYPPAFSAERQAELEAALEDPCVLDAVMDHATTKIIDQAFQAYVLGISQKMKAFEALINAVFFPKKLVVAAGDDLVITAEDPLIIEDPSIVALGNVTIEAGGYIEAKATAEIDAQKVTSL